jgi:hypothetical protein
MAEVVRPTRAYGGRRRIPSPLSKHWSSPGDWSRRRMRRRVGLGGVARLMWRQAVSAGGSDPRLASAHLHQGIGRGGRVAALLCLAGHTSVRSSLPARPACSVCSDLPRGSSRAGQPAPRIPTITTRGFWYP